MPAGTAAIAKLLSDAGANVVEITGTAAQQNFVNATPGQTVQQAFSETSNAIEFTSSSATNAAFNSAGAPTFSNSATITENTLVRLGTSPDSAMTGRFWTPLESLLDSNGNLLSQSQIESVLDLPPGSYTNIAIGGQYPAGTTVTVGEVAGGEAGFGGVGGATQAFGEAAAVGTDVVEASEGLQLLEAAAILLLDRNRHPMAHRRTVH